MVTASQEIQAKIEGDISGQVAVGTHILQIGNVNGGLRSNIQQTQTQIASKLNPEEIQELKQLFEQLKSQVQENAPAATMEAALERIDELEEATMGEQPDPSTMEYVRNWFRKNIPMLAEAVTQVITNPLVGKMIGAAGDLIASEFKRRFGLP